MNLNFFPAARRPQEIRSPTRFAFVFSLSTFGFLILSGLSAGLLARYWTAARSDMSFGRLVDAGWTAWRPSATSFDTSFGSCRSCRPFHESSPATSASLLQLLLLDVRLPVSDHIVAITEALLAEVTNESTVSVLKRRPWSGSYHSAGRRSTSSR